MKKSNNDFIKFDDFLDENLVDDNFKQLFEQEKLKIQVVNQIINLRKSNNLTQKQMSALVDVPQGNISRLESGKVEPSLEFIQKIASKMGYNVSLNFSKIT